MIRVLGGVAAAGMLIAVLPSSASAQVATSTSARLAPCASLPCNVFAGALATDGVTNGPQSLAFSPANYGQYTGGATYSGPDFLLTGVVGSLPSEIGLPSIGASAQVGDGWIGYGRADVVQKFIWTGVGELDPSVFFNGYLHFNTTALPRSVVAGVAIVKNISLDDLRTQYTPPDFSFQTAFQANCENRTSAVSFASYRVGANAGGMEDTSEQLGFANCGSQTIASGESFYMWSRLFTIAALGGAVDARSTFTVDLADDLTEEQRAAVLAGLDIAPVPEPGTWALMIAGFGGVGQLIRRQRRVAVG